MYPNLTSVTNCKTDNMTNNVINTILCIMTLSIVLFKVVTLLETKFEIWREGVHPSQQVGPHFWVVSSLMVVTNWILLSVSSLIISYGIISSVNSHCVVHITVAPVTSPTWQLFVWRSREYICTCSPTTRNGGKKKSPRVSLISIF